jgi:uncharacterized YccA/Bax inhibitor family protein
MNTFAARYPYISEDSFRDFVPGMEPAMSRNGVVAKSFLLLAVLAAGVGAGVCLPFFASIARDILPAAARQPVFLDMEAFPYVWPGILGLILGIVYLAASFTERAQIYFAPAFAFFQGMSMAALAAALNSRLPGIVAVAFFATCAILAALLLAYRFDCLPDLGNWSAGIGMFFITIVAVYAGVFLMRLFGLDIPYPKQTTLVYWAFVCGFMVFLCYQLMNSFTFIDDAIEMGAPKWMEWRAAFGLLVALLAIYYEVLRILASRRKSSRD